MGGDLSVTSGQPGVKRRELFPGLQQQRMDWIGKPRVFGQFGESSKEPI